MPRPRKSIPSYLEHKQSGKARAVWTTPTGQRSFRMLPGSYDSPESRSAFARLVNELAISPIETLEPSDRITVNEVFLGYLVHAERHYRGEDGRQSEEVRHIKRACRFVRELYGTTPAKEFGPLKLKAVRQKYISAGWCRKTINARVDRVRRAFKWAVAEEMVPPSVYQAITAVSGLQRGRTSARESEPVLPVEDAVVAATLPHVNRHVRGLIELQRLTGCRPGEACRLRRCDIDMSEPIWLYRPSRHKGTWRGKDRVIAIGPRAQSLLHEYFTNDPNDYLFSPRRATEEQNAERTAKRKTPRYPSHMKRNETKRVGDKRTRPPAEKYSKGSYETAIDRACDKIYPAPGELAKRQDESLKTWLARLTPEERKALLEWQKKHRWSPNQLRHTYATKVRKQHGLEAAQVMLGHSKADVTQIYAEKNIGMATDIAARIG